MLNLCVNIMFWIVFHINFYFFFGLKVDETVNSLLLAVDDEL